MKKLLTLLLLTILFAFDATAQNKKIDRNIGAMGFKLGMTKDEVKKVVKSKGWTDMDMTSTPNMWGMLSIDSPLLIYGTQIIHVNLIFGGNKLANMGFSSYPMEYSPTMKITGYGFDLIIGSLEEKYGRPTFIAYGYGEERKAPANYKSLVIPPTTEDCHNPEKQLQLIWAGTHSRISISYMRKRNYIYAVFMYTDDKISEDAKGDILESI